MSSYITDGLARINSSYGASSGQIWLDDVACTSSNTKLLHCFSSPIGSHSCNHSDEAGVKCEGTTLKQGYCHSNFIC